MFLGEYQHSLDAKGRVILPARYRDQLADGAFVTKGLGGCLAVYTPEGFEEVASKAREQSMQGDKWLNVARSFFGGALDITLDRQGRFAIPQTLRDYASLQREVVVVGMYSRIEIWDREKWQEINQAGAAALTGDDELPAFGI